MARCHYVRTIPVGNVRRDQAVVKPEAHGDRRLRVIRPAADSNVVGLPNTEQFNGVDVAPAKLASAERVISRRLYAAVFSNLACTKAGIRPIPQQLADATGSPSADWGFGGVRGEENIPNRRG
jgi:hypothetical protein